MIHSFLVRKQIVSFFIHETNEEVIRVIKFWKLPKWVIDKIAFCIQTSNKSGLTFGYRNKSNKKEVLVWINPVMKDKLEDVVLHECLHAMIYLFRSDKTGKLNISRKAEEEFVQMYEGLYTGIQKFLCI